ncbi:uncharacterized protein K452DRAFT_63789 [Aplosporella prunicola CBS 121167]|uniref:Uncharacterized protein n=1 Tax=Aplosporella prunicola CBS 121167 TaxID=1176127 RepID=A0A6A6B6M0_9PEZI|nr:uncharacterized protein K452DRAFT_63789 [Aplosporella prunicola CBS 121167]KAF2139660.1 hypothetical protein K452DRAFT_63789 [Aplosporella prunicola CBS 121167]
MIPSLRLFPSAVRPALSRQRALFHQSTRAHGGTVDLHINWGCSTRAQGSPDSVASTFARPLAPRHIVIVLARRVLPDGSISYLLRLRAFPTSRARRQRPCCHLLRPPSAQCCQPQPGNRQIVSTSRSLSSLSRTLFLFCEPSFRPWRRERGAPHWARPLSVPRFLKGGDSVGLGERHIDTQDRYREACPLLVTVPRSSYVYCRPG